MQIDNRKDYESFLRSLDPIAEWPANHIAANFDFSRYSKIVDIGGGSGAYSRAIVKKNPNIQAVIFDLPHVCEFLEGFVTGDELSERIQCYSGNFLHDKFPEGMDLAFLSNILHGFGPEQCEFILKRVFDALPSKGGVIINDLILDEDGCGPELSVLLSFYFLLITEKGRNYTASEYKAMLENAGFTDIHSHSSSADTKYIAAIKP